jgi:hypothetical protein
MRPLQNNYSPDGLAGELDTGHEFSTDITTVDGFIVVIEFQQKSRYWV